jgi:hypothetical protein
MEHELIAMTLLTCMACKAQRCTRCSAGKVRSTSCQVARLAPTSKVVVKGRRRAMGRPLPSTAASEAQSCSSRWRQLAWQLPSPSYTQPGANSATDSPGKRATNFETVSHSTLKCNESVYMKANPTSSQVRLRRSARRKDAQMHGQHLHSGLPQRRRRS